MLLPLELLDDVADLEGGPELETEVLHHHVRGEKKQRLACTQQHT